MSRSRSPMFSRNEERTWAIWGRSYDHYDHPTRYTNRLTAAHTTHHDGDVLMTDTALWPYELTVRSVGVVARKMSRHGSPLGGTKANRRAVRRRGIQRARKLPPYVDVDWPFDE